MGVFTALLDTNVLWPSLLRDFLLSLARRELAAPCVPCTDIVVVGAADASDDALGGPVLV